MMSDRTVDGFEKAMLDESRAAPFDANHIEHGLTKRELFAAMAMQGNCANHLCHGESPERIAAWAVEQADALIAELCK